MINHATRPQAWIQKFRLGGGDRNKGREGRVAEGHDCVGSGEGYSLPNGSGVRKGGDEGVYGKRSPPPAASGVGPSPPPLPMDLPLLDSQIYSPHATLVYHETLRCGSCVVGSERRSRTQGLR